MTGTTTPPTITVNGRPIPLEAADLQQLVEQLGRARPGTAVALNDAVIPRSAWTQTKLAADDRIEIVVAVQGG